MIASDCRRRGRKAPQAQGVGESAVHQCRAVKSRGRKEAAPPWRAQAKGPTCPVESRGCKAAGRAAARRLSRGRHQADAGSRGAAQQVARSARPRTEECGGGPAAGGSWTGGGAMVARAGGGAVKKSGLGDGRLSPCTCAKFRAPAVPCALRLAAVATPMPGGRGASPLKSGAVVRTRSRNKDKGGDNGQLEGGAGHVAMGKSSAPTSWVRSRRLRMRGARR